MSVTNQLQYLQTYSSKSTTKNAKYVIRLFLHSVYGEGTLEELAPQYFKEKREPKLDIQALFSEIKHRPPASIRVILSHIKIFLMENDVELATKFWKRLSRRIKGNNITALLVAQELMGNHRH